jgi:hypothetical protein
MPKRIEGIVKAPLKIPKQAGHTPFKDPPRRDLKAEGEKKKSEGMGSILKAGVSLGSAAAKSGAEDAPATGMDNMNVRSGDTPTTIPLGTPAKPPAPIVTGAPGPNPAVTSELGESQEAMRLRMEEERKQRMLSGIDRKMKQRY